MTDQKQRSTLEEIALQIPGYSGYMRREARREADRSARAALVAALKSAKDHAGRVKTAAATRGDLSALGPLENATDRLSRAISRVQNADSGYAGFFDAALAESTLDSLYQLDLALISEARAVDEAASSLDTATVSALTERIDRFESEFDRRRSILKGA